jgi:glc operon protein GlcG
VRVREPYRFESADRQLRHFTATHSQLWVLTHASAGPRAPLTTLALQKRDATANSGHTLRMAQAYGSSIHIEAAKRTAAGAIAEAQRNGWTMAVAVVDGAGDLVYFEKMDETQTGSVTVAQAKARSAARFKRPTKVFQDSLTATPDGLRILGIEGAVPVEGGVPIVVGEKIIGAIGVSGGTSAQDGQCAKSGVDAV